VTNKLRQEVQELRSQLEAQKASWDELREELEDSEETCAELRAELSELKQKSVTAEKGLPEAADLYNQLKAKRKKSKADLADLEVILEILEG
jgi:chromosome segregation ATPase